MPDTPDSHGDSVVVLADARTDTERELIGGWAQSAHPGAQVVDSDDPGSVAGLLWTRIRCSCPRA